MAVIQMMAPDGVTSVSAGGRSIPIRPDCTVILEHFDPAVADLQSHGFTICAAPPPRVPVAEMTRAQAVMALTDQFLAETAALTTDEIKARLESCPGPDTVNDPIGAMSRGDLFALLKERGIAVDARWTNEALRAVAREPVTDAA